MIRTILVEDDSYMQKHFAAMLRSDERFSVAGIFRDAFEVENRCGTDIDLVLMDVLTLHKHSGLAAGKRIKERYPHIKIVIITSLIDPNVLSEAKRGAADSLWYKDTEEELLMEAVRRTMAGEHIFPDAPPVVEVGTARSTEFTNAEMKVLRCLVRGMSYGAIAGALGIEVTTVKYHVSNMLQKTNLENKLQLAITASEAKLVVELNEK